MENSAFLQSLDKVLNNADKLIGAWLENNPNSKLPIPQLMTMLANDMSLDESQIKDYNPIIRFWLKTSDSWYSSRGAGGGIMKREAFNKKLELKKIKEETKNQIEKEIQEKLDKDLAKEDSENNE